MVEETLSLLQKLSNAPKQVDLSKPNSSRIVSAKIQEPVINRPIKVQIFSRHIPIQNTVGNATYILDFIRYLHYAGCEIEYTVLSSSPNGGIPFYIIPSSLAAIATVSARDNLRIGRVLLKFNSLSQWLLAPLQLAYRQVPNNWKSFYRAVWNKLRNKREDAIAPQTWDALATPEEVAFANSRFVSFQPDVVIANYTWLGSLLEALPQKQSVLKAILTHDILHQRVADFRKIGVDSHLSDWNWDKESALLRKAQVLLAIQEQEAEILKEMAPSSKVISMPMSVVCHVHETQQVDGRCLFVGSGSPHNVHGLRWFLENVWLLVLDAAPYCSLHVCGDVCAQIQGSFPNVRFLGRVANLKPEYGAAQVCMVPLLMGSGLKIKLVEALSSGRACVSTPIGVQGLSDIVGHAVLVAETAEEFAAAIHTLITNPEKRKWMEAQAHQYVKGKLSPQAVYQPFLHQIEQHIQQVTNSVLK
ncbi:glycosyltransferase family 4 protein [Scytonema hofmannii FACHB-248]|uniref:Glycosyltransferase family 4 protein n=2 Tax=Cyanophyceae TaxID=3028117 RepID=A0ABR8GQ85_9CYAN|nr:glycosyltransferase family 4 protein [Scytonema hofmannii FACHB-248]